MKLLRIIRSTNPESGGPIEGLLRSSEVLLRDGHEVEVVSLESPEEAASRHFPFPVIALGPGVGRYSFNPRLPSWIRENAKHYDAVVLHGLWNYSSVGAWQGLREQSVPYYVFSHGMMDPWFRKKYPLKHMAKLAYWWMGEGRVVRDAEAVLFTSEEERLRARRVFYGHSYRERVVRYGTAGPTGEAEAQTRALVTAFPKLIGRRFLLFLSRIHPKKGCDLLIRAFAEIAEKDPDLDLAMAGPDQVGWIAKLKGMAEGRGIAERVHWLGMLKGDLKWGAMRCAEALVLPSHQENFGIVVAEAMACSTPVLISNKVNIWREVESSQGGLVEDDTEDGVRNLIRRFYALAPEQRLQMGVAARQGFLNYFDSETAARDFSEAIGFSPKRKIAQPQKRRILQIIRSTDSASGGPIEALVRNSEILQRAGHEVEVVSLEDEKQAAARSFPFRVIGVGAGFGRFGYNPRLDEWMRKNAQRFDAVVLHGLWNYSSFGAWRGLRSGETPYFIYAHGMMDPWFRSNDPLKHVAKQVYWLFAEGRVLRDASGVLFTCEEERLRARHVFHGYSYKEQLIRLGSADPEGNADREVQTFQSQIPAIRGKKFLLFMGRIHPKKGCDLLINAFADVLSAIPTGLDLVIAGPDQVGWVPRLQALARRRGVQDRVHWTGMLKGEAKWGAFRSAEAMVLPSHQENFGFVVAESMACSTPVLISDKVNIWREVVSSQGGLVEPDTLEGTRNLLRRFFGLSQEERELMEEAARRGYLEHFAMEGAAKDLLHLVEETAQS